MSAFHPTSPLLVLAGDGRTGADYSAVALGDAQPPVSDDPKAAHGR